MTSIHQLPERLVPWHRQHKRDLPWRTDPSPYHTWVSEIMLQQTRIEAVIPYYYRFLNELPTVAHLANASQERLLKLWEGLGYYSRVRNLKKAAVMIMEQHGGQLPATFSELRKLPGIGDYTAGAIASMAFGQPEPAVDGNVLRVMTRITGDFGDITLASTKKSITEILRSIYPSGADAGDFTEGLMELGETVCIPAGVPRCHQCPVQELCVAYKDGLTQTLPVKSEKKQRKIEKKTVFVLRWGDCYALEKREEKGLLSGMWQFPNVQGELTAKKRASFADDFGAAADAFTPIGDAKHIFTHIEWHMKGYLLDVPAALPQYVWVTKEELLHEYALPVAFRCYKEYVIKQGE